MIKERIFTYGEHQHGLGILSEPADTSSSPIIVMLNAGLSHRAEPYRLNVLLGRKLAELGYIGLRVDLSGKGDSPARENMTNRESVALDWSFIKAALEKLYGARPILIFGLCSGADNGIKICADDPSVKGLILLDPVSRQDSGFTKRDLYRKLTNPRKWLKMHNILSRRLAKRGARDDIDSSSTIKLRDEPNASDMDLCFNGLMKKNGRVLAVFTSQALYHYNSQGQFAVAMGIPGLDQIVEEVFWPNAKHVYPIEWHRNQLMETVESWAKSNLSHFLSLDAK
ncbi:hypothetical protein [Marinobacter sediminum]|uniref:hypothetical protein n=1 Tax=Marinobacter sediminum TaxID=256323 RepID=UPI00193A1357|nr:hypothetical protein [Marinobacter sediminum]